MASGHKIRYLIGALLLLYGVYQTYLGAYWEVILYVPTGLAFITMALVKEDRFQQYHRLLNILSWVLIIFSVLIFLFLVQTD